jgi:hypothetical protein
MVSARFDVLEGAPYILPLHYGSGLPAKVLRACARAGKYRRAGHRGH